MSLQFYYRDSPSESSCFGVPFICDVKRATIGLGLDLSGLSAQAPFTMIMKYFMPPPKKNPVTAQTVNFPLTLTWIIAFGVIKR